MSIPLDRLYQYIENVAQDVYGDTVIYRFYPHGSKNINDLTELYNYSWVFRRIHPEIICYDQEPLNYKLYENTPLREFKYKGLVEEPLNNLRIKLHNIHDRCVLLHSEKNSTDLEQYKEHGFVPVYYWSHAIIARDWFRYAEHCNIVPTKQQKTFLIYNRAWSGTREYRLKFLDLLIDHDLDSFCKTSFNPVEPETNIYYKNYNFSNNQFCPMNKLENYFPPTLTASTASADFNIDDYRSTQIEVVLETLFNDNRTHLTEKIIRPIACGHPFILASTPGALEYLKSYGFKTFDTVFNESYDSIQNPEQRLLAIINLMKEISQWTENVKIEKFKQIKEIVDYNKNHFFSQKFDNFVISELKTNLYQGLLELTTKNTSAIYINRRKQWSKVKPVKDMLTENRCQQLEVLKKARSYYNQYYNKY